MGWPLAFRRSILLLGMAAAAAVSLSACGRNGSLEIPPGPLGFQPAPAALGAPPPGPVATAPADASATPQTSQDTIAKTGFDQHGNPAATPGQKKPFLLDPLLQ
jgi:predicted small lipoprotein YifL